MPLLLQVFSLICELCLLALCARTRRIFFVRGHAYLVCAIIHKYFEAQETKWSRWVTFNGVRQETVGSWTGSQPTRCVAKALRVFLCSSESVLIHIGNTLRDISPLRHRSPLWTPLGESKSACAYPSLSVINAKIS